MKFARIMHEQKELWAEVAQSLKILKAAPYEGIEYTGEELPADADVKYLAPCTPTKVVAVGKNYHDHVLEFSSEPMPEKPVLFYKPLSSVIGHGEDIQRPEMSNRVDHEGELAFVVSKTAKNVKREDAHNYIFGYTCLNDVTARDIQKSEGQWTRGKSFDTFCPIGPVVVTDIDCTALDICCRVNGEVKQQSNTKHMMWDIPFLLEFITECMTLNPGDVVTTGTPAGISPMVRGDVCEVEIEGIGILKNNVV